MNALTEEEQLNNLKSLTKKYGSATISGVLVALIAFLAGVIGKRNSYIVRKMKLHGFNS